MFFSGETLHGANSDQSKFERKKTKIKGSGHIEVLS